MLKSSRHSPRPLEVTVMFEPHRLQQDLLQAAYASLVPEPRKRLIGRQPTLLAPSAQPLRRGERKKL